MRVTQARHGFDGVNLEILGLFHLRPVDPGPLLQRRTFVPCRFHALKARPCLRILLLVGVVRPALNDVVRIARDHDLDVRHLGVDGAPGPLRFVRLLDSIRIELDKHLVFLNGVHCLVP
ncbi:hypothetical protein D3C86_1741430 [compost metagenome]